MDRLPPLPIGLQGSSIYRLLKNARLRRSPHPSLLRRTFKYASLLRISGALNSGILDQPAKNDFSNRFNSSNPGPLESLNPVC